MKVAPVDDRVGPIVYEVSRMLLFGYGGADVNSALLVCGTATSSTRPIVETHDGEIYILF